MAQYGEDKALSMGGSLPAQDLNGLVAEYERLRKATDAVIVVAVFETNYVKTRRRGNKPDEPVLMLTRVEVGHGPDEQALHEMLDRLNALRTGDPTLASQGELTVP